MFRDGTYTVWFRTSLGQGTATVHLAEGKISGGDCFFGYRGTYEVVDHSFTATLTTSRIADGPTTVLGLDEVELNLTGTFHDTMGRCTGTSAQAPNIDFEAILFLGQDQSRPSQSEAPRAVSASNIARLPKVANERNRGRNPFGSGSLR